MYENNKKNAEKYSTGLQAAAFISAKGIFYPSFFQWTADDRRPHSKCESVKVPAAAIQYNSRDTGWVKGKHERSPGGVFPWKLSKSAA